MSQTIPKETLAGQKCPLCDKGYFKLIQIDHQEECPDSPALVVPDVWVDRCNSCHEMVYPAETTRYIEQIVDEQTEQLTPHDLEKIREDLGLDQTEISKILGLGSKSYHRWENGTQFPSRSMCYYIRVLAEFPEAFAWLRQRAWQQKNRLRYNKAKENRANAFPALMRLEAEKGSDQITFMPVNTDTNYPRVFTRIGIK